MQIKKGVDLRGLKPEMAPVLVAAETVFQHFGVEAIVTSGLEGKHKRNSKHYNGYALDFRVWHITRTDPKTPEDDRYETIAVMLRRSLGDQYDVVLEGTPHIHIEFDPD